MSANWINCWYFGINLLQPFSIKFCFNIFSIATATDIISTAFWHWKSVMCRQGKHIETPKNIKAANYSKLFYKWKSSPPQLLNCICSNNIFKHGMRKHARCLVNDDFNFILITSWCLFVIFETMFSRSQNSFIAHKTTVHRLLIWIWSKMKVSKWLFL